MSSHFLIAHQTGFALCSLFTLEICAVSVYLGETRAPLAQIVRLISPRLTLFPSDMQRNVKRNGETEGA